MTIHPLYAQYFSHLQHDAKIAPLNQNWGDFQSTPQEVQNGPEKPDFSFDQRTWDKNCAKIGWLALKILCFPWILLEAIRFIAQRIGMTFLYPAQSCILKCAKPMLQTANLDSLRQSEAQSLTEQGYVVRHVRLDKEGTAYSGILIGRPETLRNGKWVLQANGNNAGIEEAIGVVHEYRKIDYNLLLINGPGVGRSKGLATTQNLWEPQELGLSFLEKAVRAKRIVAAGFSLGGAVMADALTKHACKTDEISYLSISQMSFDNVMNAAQKLIENKAPRLFSFFRFLAWLGDAEMDAIAPSKKMIAMKIPQAIIQAGLNSTQFQYDGAIPHDATLGYRLHQEKILELKSFYYIPNGKHLTPPLAESNPFAASNIAIQRWEETLSDSRFNTTIAN